MMRCLFTVALTMLALAGGCASEPPLPHYPIEDAALTLPMISSRAQALQQVTGKGAVTLDNASRGSIRLDAVFVLEPPERARIRAWKFGQAAFDLTLTPDGVWLYAPHDDASQLPTSKNVGAGIRQWLAYLSKGIPETYVVRKANAQELVLDSDDPSSGGTLTTTIDRPTRTVRSYRLVDAGGIERFTLSLDRYRDFAGTLWPARITAKSQSGTIIVETRELQPNVAAPTAFKPPARAKRLP